MPPPWLTWGRPRDDRGRRMPRRPALRAVSAATVLVFAAWTCGPGAPSAWAAGPSVAVVGVHGNGGQDDGALRALSADLAAGFAAAGLDVRSGDALGALLRPERDRVLERVYLEPVTRAFEEGRILYEKAQPEQAVAALERAAAELADSGEFLREGRLRVDVPLYLGLSWIALGETDKASPAFADVVRADPDRVLDTLDYPPNIVEAFDRVRADVLAGDLGSVAVAVADGAAARVFLDGRLVGSAPITVRGLPPGAHTVLVDGSTAGRHYEALDLAPGQAARIDATLQRRALERSDGDALLPARSGLTRRLYREIGTASGAAVVAVAAFDGAGDLRVALYSTRSETFSLAVVASLAGVPGSRSAFVKQLAGRAAAAVDEGGGVLPDQVATEALPMRLGANPTLTDLLLGPPPGAPSPAAAAEPTAAPAAKPGPHPAGIVALIVGGLLAGAGAGVAIWAGTRTVEDPGGALVIEFP
jgi:hypothetical protein